MKLMLDHTQRLNLHALLGALGAQRADVGSIRAISQVQSAFPMPCFRPDDPAPTKPSGG